MTSRRNQLRARIAEIQKQGVSNRRYGAELKRAIVAYSRDRRAENATIKQIAHELGLSATQLGRWLRHAERRLRAGKQPFARSQRWLSNWLNETVAQQLSGPGRMPPNGSNGNMISNHEHEETEMVFVVRCHHVHISAVARERLRELLDA